MKRKGPRAIPDFSRHPSPSKHVASAPPTAAPRVAPTAPRPVVKPATTTSKIGRRGQ